MAENEHFIESDHPQYLAIKQSGIIPTAKLHFLSYLYRFYPCTNNELIKRIQIERPDLGPNELMAFNKHPNDLKENGTITIVELRRCLETGKLAQVLAPTFHLPCQKGMRVFAEKFIVNDDEIRTDLSAVVFGTKRDEEEKLAIKYCIHKFPAALKRFRNEVELMLQLQGHKEVVEILEFKLDEHPPYFVMPQAQGDLSSLGSRLKTDLLLQRNVFTNLMECIELLHSKGILHRDIKPQNFLVFSDTDIKVIDFGISRQPMNDTTTRVTVTGIPGGTEQFAPPEFFEPSGFKEADQTWDIYSLGATIFNLMTGRNARFLINPGDVPSSVFQVLGRSMSILQADRYQTVTDFKEHLNAAYDEVLLESHAASAAYSIFEGQKKIDQIFQHFI